MRDLKIGDMVKAATREGVTTFSPVYFFGHQDAAARGSYLQLAVQELSAAAVSWGAAAGKTPKKLLELSPLHFIPVAGGSHSQCPAWERRQMKRAADVRIGDAVWADSDHEAALPLHR